MTRPGRGPDPWIAAAVAAGAALRVLPMLRWPSPECSRDECIYRSLAQEILDTGWLGTASKGWLPAPGYPWTLAWLHQQTGSWETVKWLQIALALLAIPTMAALARRVQDGPRSVAAGRWAAWLFALHPTLAWFTNTLWIESIYIPFLLFAALGVLTTREVQRPALPAGAAGVALGVCVLFKGVATWLPPIFALAVLWPGSEGWRAALRSRGRATAALLLGATLTVAPYSQFASRHYGGFMVSDATMGHVLYLGNNTYEPITFDYGNGALTNSLFSRLLRQGRPMCVAVEPVKDDRCDVRRAVAWIRENPATFVERIPLRLAQQLNPNSFLTRHIRWGRFDGLPWAAKEALCAWVALSTAVVVLGGTLGGAARARGPFGVLAVGTIAYTLASAAVAYGMSRFRLPLEPLWMVWLAALLADPRGAWAALRASPVRLGCAAVALPGFAWLMAWFALTGFPMFWR